MAVKLARRGAEATGPVYKLEEFAVPMERLDCHQMNIAAYKVYDNARSVYSEDPGVWPTFAMYLAFRIGVESIQYVCGGREDMERFAKAVMGHAL